MMVKMANMRNSLIFEKMDSGEIGQGDTVVGGQLGRPSMMGGLLFGAIGALISNISALTSGRHFVMVINQNTNSATIYTISKNVNRQRKIFIAPQNLEFINVRGNFGGTLRVRMKLTTDALHQDMQVVPIARGENMAQVMQMLMGLQGGQRVNQEQVREPEYEWQKNK